MSSKLQKTYNFRNFFHWSELSFLVPGTSMQFSMVYSIDRHIYQPWNALPNHFWNSFSAFFWRNVRKEKPEEIKCYPQQHRKVFWGLFPMWLSDVEHKECFSKSDEQTTAGSRRPEGDTLPNKSNFYLILQYLRFLVLQILRTLVMPLLPSTILLLLLLFLVFFVGKT